MSHVITPRGRKKTFDLPAPHDVELLQVHDLAGGTAVGPTWVTVPLTTVAENTRPYYFTVAAAGITNDERLARAAIDYAVSAGTTDGASWRIEILLELDGVEIPGTRRYAHGVSDDVEDTVVTFDSVVTKTAAYTATDDDKIILCDASSGAFTITLRTAVNISGKDYTVKKIDSSANTVTIDGSGSETIDDGETAILTDQYESLTIVSNNVEWFVS